MADNLFQFSNTYLAAHGDDETSVVKARGKTPTLVELETIAQKRLPDY